MSCWRGFDQRGVALREGSTDPEMMGQAMFELARALRDSRRDRVRARDLAEKAAVEYGRAPAAQDELSEVEAWLATHRG